MSDGEPRGKRIEHRAAIAAPREKVWGILSDLATWPEWNALNPTATGTLAPGEQLEITVVLPGMKPQPAHPMILSVDPGKGFRYATRGAGGLMRAHRYFVIKPRGPGACEITNGEIFSGPLGRLVAVLMGNKIHEGMAVLNVGLKAYAEKAQS